MVSTNCRIFVNENIGQSCNPLSAASAVSLSLIACLSMYLLRCYLSSGYGGHARARHIAKTKFENDKIPIDIDEWAKWAASGIDKRKKWWKKWRHTSPEKETVLSACSVLQAISSNWSSVEKKEQFVQRWTGKRNDVVVMNHAIVAGTVVCTIGVLLLTLLPGWSLQPYGHKDWICLVAIVCLQVIIWYVNSFLHTGIAIVIAGLFKLRQRCLNCVKLRQKTGDL